jgi:TolB-like protein/Tfp pilus assembly protein PilF
MARRMDPLLSRLQRGLAGRYALEHELGRGGMARVYLGRDLRLERRVAIKVFERADGSPTATDRFLREIRVAAQLQHPNIVPVFESGESGGVVYYVMPYIKGASLRERIEREGPLPIADAVRIAREVAEALDHAHRAGIVHRDIKPDNIMLADGMAVVADFGIARAIEESGGKITETGLALGTPMYMSPEQASGSQQVDGRTDIYALGCVLYEMLAGTPPFSGTNAQAVMARHVTDAVPPLATVRPVPPTFDVIVQKALAKLPADRFPTGRSFADALANELTSERRAPAPRPTPYRVAIVGAASLIVVATALVAWRALPLRSARGVRADEPLRSVAVLPVKVADTVVAAIADGMTEAIITGLYRLEGLTVTPPERAFAYRDRQDDARAVGRELGVGTVLASSLQHAGTELRLTARLINVADGRVLWTEHLDGDRLHYFAMQDSVTARIADALLPRLDAARRAAVIRGPGTRDTVALRLFLEARRAINTVAPDSVRRAITLLEEAVARDSMYADAWVALAEANYDYPMEEKAPLVRALWLRRALDRLIALDSTNGLAFSIRGRLHEEEWDDAGARRDYEHALRLAPGSPLVLLNFGSFLNFANEFDTALVLTRRAVQLDPTNTRTWWKLANRFAFAHMPDSARVAAERSVNLAPTNPVPNWVLMNVYLDQGARAKADSAARRLERFGGNLALSALYYRRAGDRKNAQRILDTLEARARHENVNGSTIGAARLAVGDTAGAFDALEQSVRNHDFRVRQDLILVYSPLKGHPRFDAAWRTVFGNRPVTRTPFP